MKPAAILALALTAWTPATYACLSNCGGSTGGSTGGAPANAAGHISLTKPNEGVDLFFEMMQILGSRLRPGWQDTGYFDLEPGTATPRDLGIARYLNEATDRVLLQASKSKGLDGAIGRQFVGEEGDLVMYYGPRDARGPATDAIDRARSDWGAAPPAQGAKPQPPKPQASRDSIVDTIQEPTVEDVRKIDAERKARIDAERAADKALAQQQDADAQRVADALFSGDPDRAKTAGATLRIASREMQNRVARKIVERVQKIVDDGVRAAAGAPRTSN